MLQKRIGRLAVERADGDADACRAGHLVAVHMIGLSERGADAAGKPHGILRRIEILGHDGEFVATYLPTRSTSRVLSFSRAATSASSASPVA